MNPLHESIKNIVKPLLEERIHQTKGVVVFSAPEFNLCNVEILNPFGAGMALLERVPVQMTGGIHTPGPFVGDEVWVTFSEGKMQQPKITGFTDSNYYNNTREKKWRT